MPRLSLVAFDLDGTVLNSVTRTISARVQAALGAVHDLGGLTCVSTARSREFLGEQLEAAAWIDLFSVVNGAQVVNHATGEPVIVRPLGAELALDLFDSLAHLDPRWELYATDACWRDGHFDACVVGRDDRRFGGTLEELDDVLRGMGVVPDCRELIAGGQVLPTMVDCVFETPEIADEAEELLRQRDDIEFSRMYDVADFEITARGVTKGTAIMQLIERFGLDPDEVVAFGDSGNDLSMAGNGYRFVAMGNATPQIKDAADEICPTIDEDGVAVWLEHYLGLPSM